MEVDSMNTNQYTQKTLEALQAAQQLAVEYQHNALYGRRRAAACVGGEQFYPAGEVLIIG